MREIKFRAWDKNRKKMWSHSDLYKMDCSNEYPFLALIKGFYATNMFPGEEMDVIPMQFTGLYDKNGKEIYEGDIVRGKYGKNGSIKNFEIRWLRGRFTAVDIGTITGNECYYPLGLLEGEIIGNIYDNPELLDVNGK